MTATHLLWHYGDQDPPAAAPAPRLLCPDRGGGPDLVWTHQQEREPRFHKSVPRTPPVHPLVCAPGRGQAEGHWLQICWCPSFHSWALRGRGLRLCGLHPCPEVVTRPAPTTPLIDGSLWPRHGQRGLGPWPSSGLRARCLADPNLLPFRDPLGTSSLVRLMLLWEVQPGSQAPSSRTSLGSDGQVDGQIGRLPAVGGVLAPCVPSRPAGGHVPMSLR